MTLRQVSIASGRFGCLDFLYRAGCQVLGDTGDQNKDAILQAAQKMLCAEYIAEMFT